MKKSPEGDGVLVPKVLLHLVHILQWKAPTASDVDASGGGGGGGEGDVDAADASDATDPVRTKKAKTFLHVRCQLLMKALPKSVEVRLDSALPSFVEWFQHSVTSNFLSEVCR